MLLDSKMRRRLKKAYHGIMKIRFIPFGGVRQQGKLGDTQDIAIDVFDIGFPHILRTVRIGEDPKSQSGKDCQICIVPSDSAKASNARMEGW